MARVRSAIVAGVLLGCAASPTACKEQSEAAPAPAAAASSAPAQPSVALDTLAKLAAAPSSAPSPSAKHDPKAEPSAQAGHDDEAKKE